MPKVVRQFRSYGMLLTVHKMSRPITPEIKLRRKVQRMLRSRFSAAAWDIAVDQLAVSEVLQGENTPEWLAAMVERHGEIIARGGNSRQQLFLPARRNRREKTRIARIEAVSDALAEIARHRKGVMSFRREILKGKLVSIHEIERWINERQNDGIYRNALRVRVPRNFDWEILDRGEIGPPLSLCGQYQIEGPCPIDFLNYATPAANWVRRVPVGRDGVLREVYNLSKDLARLFTWQEAQATVFLLTDLAPLIQAEGVQLSPLTITTLPDGGQKPLSCLTHVRLTIDPAITPQELSEIYGKIRLKLLGRKPRAQSEKHLHLAVFAVKHTALDREAMNEWQREFPKWRYSRVSLFARDARTARERLLHAQPAKE